jgi:ATP-dependent DNA helicase RecG
MPQENDDPVSRVKKVLALERRRGFANDAVTCGLEEFIQRNLPAALPHVASYAALGHFDRQRAVARLAEQLEGTSESADLPPQSDALLLPVSQAAGVGEKRQEVLEKLGIATIEDLLTYFPRRLEDRTAFRTIAELKPGEDACVRGKVMVVDHVHVSRRMAVVKAAVDDGTGLVYAVWFNQPWVAKQLKRGERIDLFGTLEWSRSERQMRAPVWEPAEAGSETGRIVPIYPTTEGLTERLLRSLIARNLELYGRHFSDLLPSSLREKYGLLSKPDAVRSIHSPPDEQTFERARRSLAFEELLLLQVGLAGTVSEREGVSRAGPGVLATSFLATLPFQLTPSQQAALNEITRDLRERRQMMRLLQGDVGSGKTVVALSAALYAVEAGYQVAFMVPTELLAEQHSRQFHRLLGSLPVRVALLTAGEKEKGRVKERLAEGTVDLLLGTHALIEEDVVFKNLGLVVIDEQHRFGVVQRSLIEEKGNKVDLLIMSATPIPRTIALTLYGEFDVSVIDELPCGRAGTQTVWVAEARRPEVYAEIRRLLDKGGKGYVVLPLVDESEKIDLKAAVQVAEELQASFADFGVGLVHGRLPSRERNQAMEAFRDGKVRLLVSTTVIEVGIDVLDADFMVIEHAERFGLAQLHQLRGRIGRAGQAATCFALGDAQSEEARRRLQAFAAHRDGFSIAEEDFQIRGPGDLLGTQQHGFLNRLHAVDLCRDLDLMSRAQEEARALHRAGVPPKLEREAERRFGDLLRWLRV